MNGGIIMKELKYLLSLSGKHKMKLIFSAIFSIIGTTLSAVPYLLVYQIVLELFKAYNLTGEKFKRLKDSFNDLKKESINTEIALAPYVMIFQLITDISFALLLLVSTQLFITSSINKVEFFSYIIIGLSFSNILKSFSTQYTFIQYLKLATDKLINYIMKRKFPMNLKKLLYQIIL